MLFIFLAHLLHGLRKLAPLFITQRAQRLAVKNVCQPEVENLHQPRLDDSKSFQALCLTNFDRRAKSECFDPINFIRRFTRTLKISETTHGYWLSVQTLGVSGPSAGSVLLWASCTSRVPANRIFPTRCARNFLWRHFTPTRSSLRCKNRPGWLAITARVPVPTLIRCAANLLLIIPLHESLVSCEVRLLC